MPNVPTSRAESESRSLEREDWRLAWHTCKRDTFAMGFWGYVNRSPPLAKGAMTRGHLTNGWNELVEGPFFANITHAPRILNGLD